MYFHVNIVHVLFFSKFIKISSRFFLRYSLIWIIEYRGVFFELLKAMEFRSRTEEVATGFFAIKKLLFKSVAKFKEKDLYRRLFFNKVLQKIFGKLILEMFVSYSNIWVILLLLFLYIWHQWLTAVNYFCKKVPP